jgi:hypothetical protein
MAPPRQKNVVGMNLWCAQTCVSADPRGAADAVAGIDRPLDSRPDPDLPAAFLESWRAIAASGAVRPL